MMKTKRQKIAYIIRATVFLLIVFLLVVFVIYAGHGKTTAILDIPYDQAEMRLFASLRLNKDELITRKFAQSHVSVRLREALTMGIHGHHLIEYSPGRRIHFWGEHKYNIMATGVEQIEIDLKKVSESRTRITIDYFETTRLMGFIPVTYRTGRWQENHVIKTIFGK